MAIEILFDLKRKLETLDLDLSDFGDRGKVKPTVHIGDLPPRRVEEQENLESLGQFPYILVRTMRSIIDWAEETVYVNLICGVHVRGDFMAGVSCLEKLMNACKQQLLEVTEGLGGYALDLPIEDRVGDGEKEHSQPHPEHIGIISTIWKRPIIHDRVNY